MNDVIIEMQQQFDAAEAMVEGLAFENGLTLQTLDDQTLLYSIDSMIREDKLLTETEELNKLTGESKSTKTIDQYKKIYQNLRDEKINLRKRLLSIQSVDRTLIAEHVRKNKEDITKEAIEETAKIIENRKSVTKRDIDKIYALALKKNCKKYILQYIDTL